MASTSYSYRVRAVDAAANVSGYSAVVSGTTPSVVTGDTVWVEDAIPVGGSAMNDTEIWNWTASNPAPFSGALAHTSATLAGVHQHFFYSATTPLSVSAGVSLFTYVYLDPANPPTEVILQWYDGASWEHRAYWGANSIPWGINGTNSLRYMGALPAAGQLVRLTVPASMLGLEGVNVAGMAYVLFDGHATWDRLEKQPHRSKDESRFNNHRSYLYLEQCDGYLGPHVEHRKFIEYEFPHAYYQYRQ